MYVDYHSIHRGLARASKKYVIRKTRCGFWFNYTAWYLYTPIGEQFQMLSQRQALAVVRNQLDKERQKNENA